ncbi:SDR family NAD(P)-dependent oxidoreductase [Streptomyces sp. NPDC056708]|uniref:SDR family NAD(P)-dependent oxidoreductase n=1 Tax=unclassified Streptomyces TaxID=2593676 RepID=UPI0036821A49
MKGPGAPEASAAFVRHQGEPVFATHRQVPVAVVGIGALVPGATDAAGYWRIVVGGQDLITEVPASRWLVEDHYDPDPAAPDKTYARRGAFLPEVDFDPLAYGVPPANLPATDTAQLLALMVADQVLADAGGLARMDRDRVGVVLGAAALQLLPHMYGRAHRPVWLKALRESGLAEAEAQSACDRITEHFTPWQESTFPGLLGNVVAGRIANRFDLHGTNHTTDAACASSLAALSTAVGELALGRSDLVISGGVDTGNDIGMFLCFSKTPALSPTGDCRPFSEAADGTMLGEAVVMYALKRLSDAERDGDRIHAVIRGIGTSSDGRSTAIYAPLPDGQARALRRAYEEAGYGPDTVELVEAHGTGTKAGDAAELTSLRTVFGASRRTDQQWCAIGSVKSQIGHTKCAAGAAGLLKAVMSLHHKVLPPTIKVDRPSPATTASDSPFYVNTQARPWVRSPDHPRRASVSSFGFGGSNFHVTLEEYVPSDASGGTAWRHRSAPTELVLFSASSPSALQASAFDGDRSLAAIARESHSTFSPTDPVRLAVVATDTEDLAEKFAAATALIRQRPDTAFSTPTGIQYATGIPAPGRIGFLFPGQGAQYVGMGADLAMLSPDAQAVWDRLGSAGFDGCPLHRVVFPPPAFTDEERAARRSRLAATEWAQPALAVHSLALLEVARGLGLRPDCAAGHSFGELVALHCAGVLDAESLVALARKRGTLMRDAAVAPGAMLAVGADRERVAAVLAGIGLDDVWPANHNAPRQVVLSGTTEAIAVVEKAFAAEDVDTRRLNTSTAFHSPLVAPAGERLSAFLSGIPLTEPRIEVYGNADAAPYPAPPDEVRRRLARQLASPVLFHDQIEAMYAAGVRTFVEVGAGTTLTGLVGQILGDREHAAIPLDRPGRSGVSSLHTALGRLAVRGIPLDYDHLWAPYGPPGAPAKERKPRMTVKISGANYGQPYPPAGGAAVLPAPSEPARPDSPNPPGQQAESVPVPEAPVASAPADEPVSASAPLSVPASSAGSDWYAMVESVQRQTAEAHAACQRMLIDSHMTFLRMTETTLCAMLGAQGVNGVLDDTASSSPPLLPQPSPSLFPEQSPAARTQAVPQPPAPVLVEAPTPAVLAGPPARLPSPGPSTAEDRAPDTHPDITPAVALSAQALEELLLSVVARLTGYPTDMLNVDMDLEADLGVDSIKRVEILSAVRQRTGDAPAESIAQLGRLRTLREIVDALTAGTGPVSPGAAAPDSRAAAAAPGTTEVAAVPEIPAMRTEPPQRAALTRLVPRTAESPASGLAVAALGDGPLVVTGGDCDGIDDAGIAGLVARKLTAHGIDATAVTDVPENAHGVVHLGGLTGTGSPDEAREVHRSAFHAARSVAARMASRGGLFVTVQDTGGDFGLDGRRPDRAWLGGIAGLARTAAKEWPGASVKAIDCEAGGRDLDTVAEAIVRELLEGGPETEVGLRADGTRTIPRAVPAPLTPGGATRITSESVIVATGGARGVTAAALLDLARTHRPRIVLLGRTEPATEPPGLESAADEPALTRLLAARSAGDADGSSPAEIAVRAREILAAREVRATLAALTAAGSAARYVPVDTRDGKSLAAALRDVRESWGPITGIVHGAGVLADKRIADKTDEQFDRVMSTKVDGLRALLAATADDPLDVICLFSSVAAVFGNEGQSDYAMANEVLNHVASAERSRRPDCLVRSVAWGPWHGGMVTPALAGHFGRAGVALIPLEQGAAAFSAELDGTVGEPRVVIAAGDDPAAMTPVGDPRPAQVLIRESSHPQLSDHQLAGVPVLPVAMVLNWFTGAAAAWRPATDRIVLRDVRVYKKLVLPRLAGDGNRITVHGRRGTVGAPSNLEVELRGEDGVAHFRAVLEFEAVEPDPAVWITPDGLEPPTRPEVYDGRTLFHGPRFQSIRTLHGVSGHGAEATVVGLHALDWAGDHWPLDPAAVDGALQLALIWAENVLGEATLPMAVAECRVHRRGPAPETMRCVVRARKTHETGARCDVALIDPDASVRIELLGVELVRRPS